MNKRLQKGIVIIFISNVLSLILGIITNFLLPKYLTINSYAAIKTYQLYITYAGIFHLGYIDGMYIQLGGKNILQINKEELYKNLVVFRNFQFIVSFLLLIISIFANNFILQIFSIVLVPTNILMYYKMLFQAVGEFEKYGKIMNFYSFLMFISNISLLIIIGKRKDASTFFLISYSIINIIIWIIIEFIFLKNNKCFKLTTKINFHYFYKNIQTGFTLMIGNFSSVILTSMDRWFVKKNLPIDDFAFYSFAVSVETILNTAMTPISVTLYNYFCKCKEISIIKRIKIYVMILSVFLVTLYYPAKFIIIHYLDTYLKALDSLLFLFAAQTLSFIIKGIYVNLYKANKKQGLYFSRLTIVIICAFLLNLLFFIISSKKEAFAIATVISVIIWLEFCNKDFEDIKFDFKEKAYIFGEVALYLFTGHFFEPILGGITYFLFTIIVTISLFNKEIAYLYKNRNAF